MLLLLFDRGLFKFSAAAPPLLVLLKLEPRIGTAKVLYNGFSPIEISGHLPAYFFNDL